MTQRHQGILSVSAEWLEQALHIPDGHSVTRVWQDPMRSDNAYFFVIEGPTLPCVPEGATIPQVTAVIDRSGKMAF